MDFQTAKVLYASKHWGQNPEVRPHRENWICAQKQKTRHTVHLLVAVPLPFTAIAHLAHGYSKNSTRILEVQKGRLPDRGGNISLNKNSEAVSFHRLIRVYNWNLILRRDQLCVHCTMGVAQYACTFSRFLDPWRSYFKQLGCQSYLLF